MDTSRLARLTSLARVIDPSHASNRLAIAATVAYAVVGAVATLLLTDAALIASLGAGVGYGVGAFLAWAIGRELDPDRPAAARDAVLAYAVVAWTGPPSLLAVAAAMVAVRLLARTTGRGPTPADLAAVVIAAGLAGRSPAGFVTATVLAAAVVLDARMDGDDTPERIAPVATTPRLAAAGLAFVAAFVVTLSSGAFLSGWRGPSVLDAVVAIAAGAALTRMRVGRLTSTGDLTRLPLDPIRVRRGQQLAGLAAVVGVLWTGFAGVGQLGPLLAAVIGAGVAAVRSSRPHERPSGPA